MEVYIHFYETLHFHTSFVDFDLFSKCQVFLSPLNPMWMLVDGVFALLLCVNVCSCMSVGVCMRLCAENFRPFIFAGSSLQAVHAVPAPDCDHHHHHHHGHHHRRVLIGQHNSLLTLLLSIRLVNAIACWPSYLPSDCSTNTWLSHWWYHWSVQHSDAFLFLSVGKKTASHLFCYLIGQCEIQAIRIFSMPSGPTSYSDF